VLYDFKIRLRTVVLGDEHAQSSDGRPVFRFVRSSRPGFESCWDISPQAWSFAVREALEICKADDMLPDMFGCPLPVKMPSIHLYVRRGKPSAKPFSQTKEHRHECFNSNTVLTVRASFTRSRQAPAIPCPSYADAALVLQCIGENIGISTWGSSFGYGRFDLLSIGAVEHWKPASPSFFELYASQETTHFD
jgi:hypothetical protein